MGNLHDSMRARAMALAGSLLLAACASTPIEEAPVTTGSAVATRSEPGTSSTQTSVAPVRAGDASREGAGPPAAEKVVYFDYDSASLRSEFQPVIDAHARWLASRNDRRLLIAGHTDERGGREYNLALGQQRAESVRRALQLLGVRASQIETISFGEEKPAVSGQQDSAFARNRRAELTYR